MEIFTWRPDAEPSLKQSASVFEAKYGDGYSSSTPNGLNNISGEWELTFTRGWTEALAIRSFLTARKGSEVFQWENPFNEVQYFRCKDWTVRRMLGDIIEIQARFEQVFSPT